ncbi:DNA double-strand break repair nuclease NurA [Thermoactinomyces sp. DSM 45892]|uniref:DNA double-strand break repair nuclease NurA n=1 Tax=Thermoactinomyces sp. DSM 45892 TaxID=1882753 RepID=UPI00089C4C40|nr:DNA double-strand break repair nuclease NurA [Thermoactinomyces sp. DSM 45892]SDY95606.1 NurA domain-containing protein [Thermoactinomyces sp. DSM 45892]
MFKVSEELQLKLKRLNRKLRETYPGELLHPQRIREHLSEIGEFVRIERFSDQELQDWAKDKSVVGVDGSVNSTKGIEMRTLSVFQALAKGTQGEEAWEADVYTPLIQDEWEAEGLLAREAQKRGARLSRLELKVTKKAIRDWKPHVVMMDGSLLHYHFDDADEWDKVAELAEESDVLLVGIAEEVGSRGLAKQLFPEHPAWSDRDLLYGLLDVGEAYEWSEWSPAGTKMWKMVFRSSYSPAPVGVDGLLLQKHERLSLLRLIYSLTPKQGRGIPYWLDIVDQEVRVTNPLVQTMVDQYIDPDLRHRLLSPKRSERVI